AGKRDFNAALFRANSPKLAQWLAEDPQRAAIVSDDLENLGTMEKLLDLGKWFYARGVGSVGEGLEGLGELFQTGSRSFDRAFETLGIPNPKVSVPWWLHPAGILGAPGQELKEVTAPYYMPQREPGFVGRTAEALGTMAPA